MNKLELIKFLEPFDDDIEIINFSPKYINKNGLGLIYNESQERELGILIGRQFGKEQQIRELLKEKTKGKGTLVMVGAGNSMMNQEFIKTMTDIPNVQIIEFVDKNIQPIDKLKELKEQIIKIEKLPELQGMSLTVPEDRFNFIPNGTDKSTKPGSKEYRKQMNNFSKNSHKKKRKR